MHQVTFWFTNFWCVSVTARGAGCIADLAEKLHGEAVSDPARGAGCINAAQRLQCRADVSDPARGAGCISLNNALERG